jgi:hypothetical protein
MNETVTRVEWWLVRTRRDRTEKSRVYQRSTSEAGALAAFAEHAPYGARAVSWAIEKYTVTETLNDIRVMTADEVAEVTRVAAEREGWR